MKSVSILCYLLTAPAPPHDWHWLESAQWVQQTHPTPAWRIKTQKAQGDTLRLVCYEKGIKRATYCLRRNQLVAITFHFAQDYSYQADWIYSGAEFIGAHQWLDHPAHARITARKEGKGGVGYEVRYEPD
jgi:hypothetical protein